MKKLILLFIAAACLPAGAQAGFIREKIKQRLVNKMEAKYPDFPALESAAAVEGGKTYTRHIKAGGLNRFYEVYLPASYKKGVAYPLVLCIHGGGGNAAQALKQYGLTQLADKLGFIVVGPAGTAKPPRKVLLQWNTLDNFSNDAVTGNVDDMGYFAALIDDMKSLFDIDAKRVYATGISQGGIMSYRLACDPETSKRIAAIAPVAGALTVPFADCRPAHPVSLIHFHGLKDTYVLYNGGAGPDAQRFHAKGAVPRISVTDGLAFWLAFDKIAASPVKEETRGQAALKAWGPAKNGAEVRLWTIADGGHTWPGAEASGFNEKVGKVNMDINATGLMLEFFLAHPFIPAAAK